MPEAHDPARPVATEIMRLGYFLASFNKESDRGAALVAASMLDEQLREILASFFTDTKRSRELLDHQHGGLGTFSARAVAALGLGLIEQNEFEEINIFRTIRNKFGHAWEPMTLESPAIKALVFKLPWLGPEGPTDLARTHFNAAIAILLTDLMWRIKLVESERRQVKRWSHKSRG